MEFKDYYETLGVPRTASDEELKRAYRRLARKYHPDVSKEADAEERFKEMKEAYDVLSDPEKRAAYDQFGENWKAGQDFQPPPGWAQEHGFARGAGEFSDAGDFSEFFESLFGGRGAGQGGGRFRDLRIKGEDIDARIMIPLEDAFRGGSRQISLQVPQVDAEGRVTSTRRTLNITIPKGVTAGQRIRLAGQGGPGIGGAEQGDLFLHIEFEPHPVFTPRGRDIHVKLPVTPWEMALGRTVEAPTLGGKVDLKIPPGGAQTLRLKGRGLPGNPPGDQFVELDVVVPKPSNDAERELYERLEKTSRTDPRAKLRA